MDAVKRWMVRAGVVMAAHIQVTGSAGTGEVGVIERAGVDLRRVRVSDSCGNDASKCRVRLDDLRATGAQRDAEEMHLAGAPIQDSRIGDTAEVRGHSRSAPVVHPTRVVAREDVFCSEFRRTDHQLRLRPIGLALRARRATPALRGGECRSNVSIVMLVPAL